MKVPTMCPAERGTYRLRLDADGRVLSRHPVTAWIIDEDGSQPLTFEARSAKRRDEIDLILMPDGKVSVIDGPTFRSLDAFITKLRARSKQAAGVARQPTRRLR